MSTEAGTWERLIEGGSYVSETGTSDPVEAIRWLAQWALDDVAEARRAALTSLREKVAGLPTSEAAWGSVPVVTLASVLAEIDRALQ